MRNNPPLAPRIAWDLSEEPIDIHPEKGQQILCHETGRRFASIRATSRELGISISSLHGHLARADGRKTVGGFTFSRVSD